MKYPPMQHQSVALNRCEGKRNFGFFMEMGTGKTYTTLADSERCYLAGKINAVLVVCPKVVVMNWVKREIPNHMDIPVITYGWTGKKTKAEAAAQDRLYETHHVIPPLKVFVINFDALNGSRGYDAVEKFLRTYKVMMVVDESSRIKNPKAARTKKVIELGKLAEARRILTGTPLTKAPTDLYSQFDFLKSGLLGTTSYRAFMSEYAVLIPPDSPKMIAIMRTTGARFPPQVVDTDIFGKPMYKNLDRLSDLVAPHSFRVKKSDCLDLPPKVYQTVDFELNDKQKAVYEKLEQEYTYTSRDGDILEDHSFAAIATLTKMRQTTSNFLMIQGELIDLSEDNPRLDALEEVCEEIDTQFIVWCSFNEEIRSVEARMKSLGITCRTYYGATSDTDRELAIDDFQKGEFRCFIGNPQACGIGVTLTAAEYAIYYSSDYDFDKRLQSEDRNHRIGTVNRVTYIDLVAIGTIDEKIAANLQRKSDIAEYVIDRVR